MALYRVQHGNISKRGDVYVGGEVHYVEAATYEEAFTQAGRQWGKGKMDIRLATEQEKRRTDRRLNNDAKVHPILDRRIRGRDRRINTLPSGR